MPPLKQRQRDLKDWTTQDWKTKSGNLHLKQVKDICLIVL